MGKKSKKKKTGIERDIAYRRKKAKQKGKTYVCVETLKEMLEKTHKNLTELELEEGNITMEVHKEARLESMTELIELLENIK